MVIRVLALSYQPESQVVQEANPTRIGEGDQNSSTITMPASLGNRLAFPYGRPLPASSARLPIPHHALESSAGSDLKGGGRWIRSTGGAEWQSPRMDMPIWVWPWRHRGSLPIG